ncbi:YneF family protein, partial [Oenococcus oeni]
MSWIWFLLIGLVIGLAAGMVISRFTLKSYLKKNPPINEQMLKQIGVSMGRNLSQKQINQMMS